MKRAAAPLHVATEADAPSEQQTIEARLRSHIRQLDQLSAEMAQVRQLIDGENRRLANLRGLTMRPTVDMLRHQLGVAR